MCKIRKKTRRKRGAGSETRKWEARGLTWLIWRDSLEPRGGSLDAWTGPARHGCGYSVSPLCRRRWLCCCECSPGYHVSNYYNMYSSALGVLAWLLTSTYK